MQIRLECYEHEHGTALAALRDAFNVKSESKGYPNTRQTGTEGAPCEYRYYIKLDAASPVRKQAGMLDALATDMLRFLAAVPDGSGLDKGAETERLRALYVRSAGFTDAQLLELFLEWKASLVRTVMKAPHPEGRA